jgi:hypothetical protein
MASVAPDARVTREDIEAKFREIQGEVTETAASARGTLVAVGGVIAVVAILVIFGLGRRSGKQRSTIVEIRRV